MMASGRHDQMFWQEFWDTLTRTGHWKGEIWDRRKNGEVYPKLLSVSSVKDGTGLVTHYVAIFSDITRTKESEETLQRLAHFDPLTGLPNRLLFRDRLGRAIVHGDRESRSIALMFLDLDEFKNINDSIGHPAGDQLLVDVGTRISECVRKDDTVARLGGDEFTVIMTNVGDSRDVVIIAQRILDALTRPFTLGSNEVFTSASIGISVYPNDGVDVDHLLQNADTAMYYAKAQGKNNFQFFSQDMNDDIRRLVDTEAMLRRAVETEELQVYFQPVVCCRTGDMVGAEALLRLRNPLGEMVSAASLVPVAEERGLIVSIGEWVLRTACKQIKTIQKAVCADFRVSVNVSMRQLRERDFVGTVLGVLEEAGLDSSYLELELTETSMMADPERAINVLNELRKQGVLVTVDDFGTGHSSLSYLRRLPIDKLKIDKSFFDEITSDGSQRALVRGIVSVAHGLDMVVVAEGIETEEQLKCICELGCDAWQGYHFSAAISLDEFQTLLRGNWKGAGPCNRLDAVTMTGEANTRNAEREFGKTVPGKVPSITHGCK